MAALLISGGSDGDGRITGDVNNIGGGVTLGFVDRNVNPETAAGTRTATIDGNYTQGVDAALAVRVAGVDDSAFDHLLVSGSADVGGTVAVWVNNPYDRTADVGDDFLLLDVAGTTSVDAALIEIEFTMGGGAVLLTDTGREFSLSADPDGLRLTTLALPVIEFTWEGPSTGEVTWADPDNWGGVVPRSGADVTIPFQGGGLIIVYDDAAGDLVLNSLTANESLSITGGNLGLGNEIADASSFAGGTVLNLSGGQFGGDGAIVVGGGFEWTGGQLTGSGSLDLLAATSTSISGSLVQNGITVLLPKL